VQIAAKLNGTAKYVAQISGAGFLSAHLNLANRPKESRASSVFRVEGFDTNSPTETVSVKWPELSLAIGDVVQLQLLDEGPADPPVIRKSTKESASNLFSDASLAKDLLSLVGDFERRLFELMEKSGATEPAEEHQKFKRAVGHAIVDLGEHLLSPVYRRQGVGAGGHARRTAVITSPAGVRVGDRRSGTFGLQSGSGSLRQLSAILSANHFCTSSSSQPTARSPIFIRRGKRLPISATGPASVVADARYWAERHPN